ncbi:MAG TPA: DSD1 family PLP-dependent enzyme [Caulobacteraceae bacterium]|jgi:D-serine deaminase-like pyridoxal phosphate-dependent protein
MQAETLHAHLIGRQGSRRSLNTPALVLDVEALDRNIAAMAAFAAAHGLKLRPHAKTHKSVDIARRQIAAGALGVCCAKLGEAEALAEDGIEGILITSPIVGEPATERLIALAAKSPGLMHSCDNPAAVAAIGAAAKAAGVKVTLLVDIDPGIRRTGVASAEAAVALAQQIAGHPSLTFGGVQFYAGAEQHIEAYVERREAIVGKMVKLTEAIEALKAVGLAPPIVTGGGTGTHAIDAELGVFTELQVGSYVFMDRQYNDCALRDGAAQPFETSLMIDARVISASYPFMVTIDAGLKAFATEAGEPPILSGAAEGSAYRFMGDEHGAIVPPRGVAPPKLGERVTLAAPHCDPTVNLYEAFHVVRGDTLEAIWPVSARGRSA